MPGAGKTKAAEFFLNKGFPVVSFGDVTVAALKGQKKELTESNERFYREELRQKLGMAAYAVKAEPQIEEALKEKSIVIIDGLRSFAEYEFLQKKYHFLKLVCIYARPELRHERLYKRNIRSLSPKEAVKRDLAEVTNLDMARPIALADYLIENSGTIENFHKKLDMVFGQLEIKN